MKTLGLIFALTLIGCGKVKVEGTGGGTNVGQLRPITAAVPMDPADVTRINTICQAMQSKLSRLQVALPNTTYNFAVTKSDCNGTETKQASSVQVQNNNFGYIFAGTNVAFQKVETPTDGLLSGICGNGNLTYPLSKGNGQVVFITTLITPDCVPGTNDLCILLESASVEGDNHRVHTSEWMKIYVNQLGNDPQLVGFFTDRRLVTNGFCGRDKFQATRALLQ